MTAEKVDKRKIEEYKHKDKKRINNPPVGLVTHETDKEETKKTYVYDPHLDPQLQWAGKIEHSCFEVPTVSLHVHERIDPRTIINAVRTDYEPGPKQISLFDFEEENPPLRTAIEFYKHQYNWSNRLIVGDSLLIMNSLLEKEGMAGKIQMIYIDPPYGIKYSSNFQPFVNKRPSGNTDKDQDLTQEPEMIKAFRDTWELGIHSYLTYLRDRIYLAKELLSEAGSCFVQISDENLHHVKEILDEIFGPKNFVSIISVTKTTALGSKLLPRENDYIVWFARDIDKTKYNQLFKAKKPLLTGFKRVLLPSGEIRSLTKEEKSNLKLLPKGSELVTTGDLTKPGPGSKYEIEFEGKKYNPGKRWWGTTKEGIKNLIKKGRIISTGKNIYFLRKYTDFPVQSISNVWKDTSGLGGDKIYVVQTNPKIISRCLLMTTEPGDIVFDPTCGSGTLAYVAEKWGRRWITCDTSRVAITIAKNRLMTSLYNYYRLAHSKEGVDSGFEYETVPHVTIASLANDEPDPQEILYNKPLEDKNKARVTGPFTVEAVPAPMVKPISEIDADVPVDTSIVRSGETHRHSQWKDELFNIGIRGKGGQKIEFSRLETLAGTRYLHLDGETKGSSAQRIVVSFGPEHAPLEQRQVELAIEDARKLVPTPSIIVFASFQFDPEASKDIDETNWSSVTLLKVHMNADLLTEDLKKKRVSSESFWLMGQPDITVEKIKDNKNKYKVTVNGFDYYNTRTGNIESGGSDKIAMWMLDTDYDGRSIFPRQVFFPMAGKKEGWTKLAKNLKAEIDQDLIESYRGIESLPFVLGDHKRIAVKIVDDRGIESLRIVEV